MRVRRLLIANRGEIAVRVVRTCASLGIESVLAASDADLDSTAAQMADRTVRLGPAPAARSYLDVDAVVRAAVSGGADAVHPGYGFLAENPRLARACAGAGLVFVGPGPEQLAAVGDKVRARRHAAAAGLPLLPGAEVAGAEVAGAEVAAGESGVPADPGLGWPLLVKAVGGGGGRGLRVVHGPAELAAAVHEAAAEAGAAFGDPRLYLERYVPGGRHIEVQIIGDGRQVVQLGERDCSVQRRHQKLLEEAPAPALDDELRGRLHRAAVRLGRHLGYRSLGTVEFLVEPDREAFWFLELNARIQVEHPVTEAVTGLDLVAEQLRVAEGRELRLPPGGVASHGHAIEARVIAEDPARDFAPSPGRVEQVRFPVGEGIRVDSHLQAGSEVPPYYDSLLAKVIAHAPTRAEALQRLAVALERTRITGVATNLRLQAALLRDPGLAAGGVDTGYLARVLPGLPAASLAGHDG